MKGKTEIRPVSVYILYSSSGDWDEFEVTTEGVFSTEEKAEHRKKVLEKRIEEQKNARCPVEKYYELDFDDFFDQATDRELLDFNKWSILVGMAENHNKFWIEKFELDGEE